MRSRNGVLLALACGLLAATGCDSGITGDRGDARKGGSVLVGLSEAPDSLDPALASSPEALQALWLAYTPPLTYARAEGAKGTQMVPGAAESEPSPWTTPRRTASRCARTWPTRMAGPCWPPTSGGPSPGRWC